MIFNRGNNTDIVSHCCAKPNGRFWNEFTQTQQIEINNEDVSHRYL